MEGRGSGTCAARPRRAERRLPKSVSFVCEGRESEWCPDQTVISKMYNEGEETGG